MKKKRTGSRSKRKPIRKRRKNGPALVGGFVIGTWLVLLSGVFADFTGTPGIIQAVRLDALFIYKQTQLSETEARIRRLKKLEDQLLNDPKVQEHQIRSILGYTASDELVFDFSSLNRVFESN